MARNGRAKNHRCPLRLIVSFRFLCNSEYFSKFKSLRKPHSPRKLHTSLDAFQIKARFLIRRLPQSKILFLPQEPDRLGPPQYTIEWNIRTLPQALVQAGLEIYVLFSSVLDPTFRLDRRYIYITKYSALPL